MATTAFEIVHQQQVLGKLTFYDRMIFKGHLTMLYPPLAMKAFLDRRGVLLKDFAGYVKASTECVKGPDPAGRRGRRRPVPVPG